jgi:hypothetical protein
MRHFKKNCQLQGLESIFQPSELERIHEPMARTTRLIRLGKIYLKGSHLLGNLDLNRQRERLIAIGKLKQTTWDDSDQARLELRTERRPANYIKMHIDR